MEANEPPAPNTETIAELQRALNAICREGKTKPAFLQRQLKVGYTRANAILEDLEKAGALGPKDVDGNREILRTMVDVPADEVKPLPDERPSEETRQFVENLLNGQSAVPASNDTVWFDPRRIYVGANVRTTFPETEMAELRENFRSQGFRPEISRLLVRPIEYRVRGPVVYVIEGKMAPTRLAVEWQRSGEWRSVWETFSVPADAAWRALATEEDAQAALAWLPPVELVVGGRRHRASLDVGLEAVPCAVKAMGEVDRLVTQLIENVNRAGLTPMDEGIAYQDLLALRDEAGKALFTVNSLAKQVGKPRRTIDDRLALAKLKDTSAALPLSDGTLSLSHGVLLSRLPAEVVEEVAERVLRPKFGPKPMPLAELEVLIADSYQKDLRSAKFDQVDETLPSGTRCPECDWNSVNIAKAAGEQVPRVAMCTNVACFQAKTAATEERWRKEQAAAGKKVIEPEVADRLWNHTGKDLLPQSGYVDLSKPPYPHELKDQDAKVPSWKTLVKGKGVPVEVTRDKKGVVRELVKREAAIAAAVENKHDIFKQTHAETVGTQEASKPDNPIDAAAAEIEAERKRKEEEDAREEFERVWSAQLAAVRRAIEARPEAPPGTMLAIYHAVRDCFIDGVSVAAGERGLNSEDFEEKLEQASERTVLAALCEIVIGQTFWEDADGESPLLKTLAKLFGADLKGAAKQAKAQLGEDRKQRAAAEEIAGGMKWVTKRTKAADFTWEGKECVDPDVLELAMPDESPVTCEVRVARSAKGWFFGNWHCLRTATGGATRAVREEPPEYGTRELAAAVGVRDLIEEFAKFENYAATVSRLKAYLGLIASAKKR